MPTILLEQIIELLTEWKNSFFSWANEIGDKIASIKTNTDSLPDIESNTDDIKDNTAAVITPISNINSNVTTISSDVSTIKTDTGIIKNNASAIATSSGQAAAFAEDVANNTLEVKNKITTIASDTTQMRADSGAIRSDVSEIKNTLGLYLYNTIVTEDAEGSIANFDTDLKDYLQNAVVTIPADAGGISEAKIGYVDFNQLLSVSSHTTSTNNQNDWVNVGTQSITYAVGHVYYLITTISKSDNCNVRFRYPLISTLQNGTYKFITNTPNGVYVGYQIRSTDGETATCNMSNEQLIDITKLFGSSIADYLYSLSDHGMAILSAIFSKNYYSYNTGGTMVSVESVNGSYYPNASVSFGSSITDGGELDLVTGVLKVNTTPPSLVQLSPAPIRTLKGLNSIWADCGDISVTYRETLKHYLEKQQ